MSLAHSPRADKWTCAFWNKSQCPSFFFRLFFSWRENRFRNVGKGGGPLLLSPHSNPSLASLFKSPGLTSPSERSRTHLSRGKKGRKLTTNCLPFLPIYRAIIHAPRTKARSFYPELPLASTILVYNLQLRPINRWTVSSNGLFHICSIPDRSKTPWKHGPLLSIMSHVFPFFFDIWTLTRKTEHTSTFEEKVAAKYGL